MLKLTRPRDAEEHNLGHGIIAVIKPGTTVHEAGAQAKASLAMTEMLKGVNALEEFGITCHAEELQRNQGLVLGMSELLVSIELGRMLIETWEGVGDEEGNPVDVTREWVSALFLLHPDVRTAFWRHAFGHRDMVSAEGNGLPLSPNGSQAGAMDIAGDAGKKKAPAPSGGQTKTDISALKSKTQSKASKAPPQ